MNSTFDSQCIDVRDESNFSDEYIIDTYFFSTPERYVITVFYPILLSFGLLGNLAFLAVVAKIPSMRTFTNAYLANLAVCDTVYIIAQVNDILVNYIRTAPLDISTYTSNWGCIMANSAIYVTHYTSVGLLLVMTTERYLGICRPLQHRFIATKERTVKLITMTWVLGVLYSLLVVPRFSKVFMVCVLWPNSKRFADLTSKFNLICLGIHPFFEVSSLFIQGVPVFITTAVNTVMFGGIIKTLHKRISGQDGAAGFDNRAMKSRNQVARLLIVTNAVFFLCWAPYFILTVNYAVLYLSENRIGMQISYSQLRALLWFIRGLTVVNSTTNPIIYSATNPRYRQAFLHLVGGRYDASMSSTAEKKSVTGRSTSLAKM